MYRRPLPLFASLLLLLAAGLPAQEPEDLLQQGPFVGHVGPREAFVWARARKPGRYTLTATSLANKRAVATAEALADRDLTIVWNLRELTPDMAYDYTIEFGGRKLCLACNFRTAPEPNADASVRVMFGSCAKEDEGTRATWQRVKQEGPDVVVLLGDTPYIDTTRLDHQRKRYAAFAEVEEMASILRHTPWYGTWDDHDFGKNDIDGRIIGNGNARKVFVEYHANPSYGDGEQGIYTSFRRGPVEVWLLDTRTFAAMEPSPFRNHSASLLGHKQWNWLRKSLKASTAPVKVLACGMIWNEAVRPGKLDHWGTYPWERDALFTFIGKNEIDGVVLVGGDIHRSRVVEHQCKAKAGYDIVELIVSPMHDSIIKAANQPHPGLLKDMGEPHTFLLLDAAQQGGKLTSCRARFVNDEGKEHYAIDLVADR